ncbi:MAG: PD40 domain-containing protein [Opitutae bacterium]|nr:PD40 domain-containing protein [Opitutae bacterium]
MKLWLRILLGAALALSAVASAHAAATINAAGISASPATAKPGEQVAFSIAVTNSAAATTAPVGPNANDFPMGGSANVTITLTNIAGGYTFNLTGNVSTTAAIAENGGGGTLTGTFTIPTQTTEAGAYRASVTINSVTSGGVGSSTFAVATAVLTITGQPDLQLTSLTYTAGTSYVGGDVIPMSLTYRNNSSTNSVTNVPYTPAQGGMPSYFRILIVLSSNATFGDADDFQLTSHDVNAKINADNANHTISWNQLLPGNFTGSFYVLAKIDSLNALAENDPPALQVNGNNIWGSDALNPSATLINLIPSNFPTSYLASHGTASSNTASGYSDNPSISSDGRYVVFASDATNLVSGDTNGLRDIFLYDSQTNGVRRLNVSQFADQGNAASNNPVISGDGRYVAFASDATNLVSGDTNGFSDIFVVHTATGLISRVSVNSTGTQANNPSFKPAISSTGRYIVFESTATNLVAGGTQAGVSHIYLRDRDVTNSGTFDTVGNTSTVLIDVTPANAAGNANSIQAAISADGTRVAFASKATDLVAPATTLGRQHVFVRNVAAGTTVQVSVANTTAAEGNANSQTPSLNTDGRWVAFASLATNLVAGDTNGVSDIFVYDMNAAVGAPKVVRVSISSAGAQAVDPSAANFRLGSINPTISDDGRYVVFASLANNLAPGDGLGQYSGGVGATATANIGAGGVTSLTLTAGGSGYGTTPPVVRISGGGGTGAYYTANLAAGSVISFTQVSAGSGYTSAPSVTIVPDSGDANGALDIFVVDRDITGTGAASFDKAGFTSTSMVSVNRFGYQTAGLLGIPSTAASNIYPVLSANGRFVAFPSDAENNGGLAFGATNMLPLDSNNSRDVFLADRRTTAVSPPGGNNPSVTITSPGTGTSVLVNTTKTLTASATAVVGVVANVQFYVNGIAQGGPLTVFPYTTTWTPTATGTYFLTARVTDTFGNQGISSNITVTVNAAPTVSITSPAANSIQSVGVAVPGGITASAAASTPGATIASVEFFINNVSQGSVAGPNGPYSVAWTPTAPGTYVLTAVATDSDRIPTTSAAVNVSVNQTPTTTITSPAAGATVGINTTQTITASATPAGFISGVEFFANGVSLGTDATVPYSINWTPTVAGAYNLTSVVTNSLGTTATSAAVAVTVSAAPPVSAPTVSVTPIVGSVAVNTPQILAATATANAPASNIASVQFFVNNVAVSTVSVYPFSTPWTPTAPGTYVITAKATDNLGNTNTSTATSVTVVGGTPPTISISNPGAGATILVNQPQPITATASATSGAIRQVQIVVNGAVLSTLTSFPYTTTWTPTMSGTYTLTAIATDTFGIQTTSTAVNVTVSSGTAPTVSISSPAAGATISLGLEQVLVAIATANSGTIASVQFLANGRPLGSTSTYPYNFSWTPTVTGTYQITALATDTLGNQTTSAAIGVTIAAVSPGAPVVSLTSPTAGTALPINSAVTLSANASDPDGTIASVKFLVNNVTISTVTAYPYNAQWTPTAPGTYTLTAVATDNGANQTTSASVTVTVSSGTAPSVAITAPAAASVVGVNLPQTITATATAPSGFVASVQFYVSGVLLSASTTYPYSAAWTPMATGTYTLTARVTDNLGNVADSAPVAITVTPSAPPVVSITNPRNASSYTVGTALSIAADASDPDGTITQVQFVVNGAPIGTSARSPYNVAWTPASVGNYTLTALATDNNGNITTSVPITVTIGGNAAPTVALTSPSAGLSFGLGTAVLVAASASDADGTIANVQFYANGLLVGTSSALPYTISWRPTVAGNVSLTAVATDNSGNVTTSAAVAIAVTSTSAPSIAVLNPANGSAYGIGTSIPFSATVSGGNGPLAQVQFYVNGASVGVRTAAPYIVTWSPTAPGTYSLFAVATDSAGLSTVSSPLTVTINASVAPTVRLTNPNAAITVAVDTAVNLSAEATVPIGKIASVRFLVNGNLLGAAVTAAPYKAVFTPTMAGTYSIVAEATDSFGNASNSTPQVVTVISGAIPSVTLLSPTTDATISTDSSLLIAVDAAPNGNPISRVDFYVGNTIVATKTAEPYTYVWQPNTAGTYAVRAVATDTMGNAISSGGAAVLVQPSSLQRGQYWVKFSSPTDGMTLLTFRNLTFSAVTNIAESAKPEIDFYANGGKFATATAVPYQATRNPTVPGIYEFYAVVRVTGATYVSAPVRVNVLANQPPSIAITSPVIGATLTAGSKVTIRATATDTDDSIDKVSFLVNGQPLSSSTTFPYTADWTPASEGIYTLTAIAKDSLGSVGGNETTSAPIYVRVTGAPGSGGSTVIPDTVYTGSLGGATDQDRFALINLGGKSAVFIGTSKTLGKTYFYPGITVDVSSNISLKDNAGKTLISGTASASGVVITLAENTPPLTLIGPITFAGVSPVAVGYYGGSLTGKNGSSLAAIVGADGSIMVYLTDGSYREAGSGSISKSGDFTVVTAQNTRIAGKIDTATGFLTGTVTGGTTGSLVGALASGAPFSDGSLRNLSTRGQVGAGEKVLIAGFVIGGTARKQILLRAIGPTLANVGVSGSLANPLLQLYREGALIASNDDWNGTATLTDAQNQAGAFAIPSNSKDAVLLVSNLAPGPYTAQVSGVSGATGVALVELYDMDSLNPFSPQRLMNISSRGDVGAGEKALIAGFIVNGNIAKKVLVRAVGPGLSTLGVNGPLANPVLSIRRGNAIIRENDDWESGNDASLVNDAVATLGTYPLTSGSKDSAILMNLPPGTYTAEVRSATTATGIAVVEVYEVP